MAGTAAASVPSQHPPSGGPHALRDTHSGAAEPQRPTLPSPRLLTGPAIIATRVPRELLAKIGKHWGSSMLSVRSFRGARALFTLWQPVIAARHRDEMAGAATSRGKRPEFRSARSGGAFTTLFAGSRRPRSAGRARSVWQSFHAFGNDLAELHHLLA